MSAHEHERLSAWLDGELPGAEAAAVEAHVAACAECAAHAAEMAAVDERFRESPAEAPPGYFDTFAARVRARVETEPRRSAGWRVPAWTWAAAAALLLAVVTPLTLKGRLSVAPAAAPLGEARPSAPSATAAVERSIGAPAKAETEPVFETSAAGATTFVPSTAIEQKAAAGGAGRPVAPGAAGTFIAPVPAPRGGGTTARAQGRAAEPPAAPALLDRVVTADAQVQSADARSANQVAGAERGIEGGVPGGVVGGVVGGVPAAQAPAPAGLTAAPVSAEPEGVADTTGFGVETRGARAKAADAPRRGASAKVAPSEAGARDETGASSIAFARLDAAAPRSAGEWRLSREEWRSFAAAHAADPRVDEAHVRAVEAAFEALRASGAEADRRTFRADAEAYLAREDASQKDRVRVLVRRAEALPR